jgi:hypothetical protein
MVATAQPSAIERLIQSPGGHLAPEVARAVLQWRFAEFDQARVADLSAKARAGALSADEQGELDWYLLLGDFLTILQSKARMALGKQSSAA